MCHETPLTSPLWKIKEIFKHFRHQWADTKKVTNLFTWTTWNSFRGSEVLQSPKQMDIGFRPWEWYCGVWENLPTKTGGKIIYKRKLAKAAGGRSKVRKKKKKNLPNSQNEQNFSSVIANYELQHLQVSSHIICRQKEPQNQQSHLSWEALLWMSRRRL